MRLAKILTSAGVLLLLSACSSDDKPIDAADPPINDPTTDGTTTDGTTTDGTTTDGTTTDGTTTDGTTTDGTTTDGTTTDGTTTDGTTTDGTTTDGTTTDGTTTDGTTTDGTTTDGTTTDGTTTDGTTTDGTTTDGTTTDGTTTDGTTTDGATTDGTITDGTTTDGTSTDGTSTDGTSTDGTSTDGTSTDGTTTDGTTTDGTTTDGTTTDGTTTDGSTTDGTTNPTTGNSDWGIVEIDSDDIVDLVGIFGRFASNVSQSEILADLLPETDVCVVTRGSEVDLSDEDDDDVIPVFSQPYEFLSAGDSLTFTNSASTYATLFKTVDGGTTGYTLNDNGSDLPAPAPDNLVLDIPGDQFPAALSVSFPNAEPVDMTLSTGFSLSRDTTFTWTPSSNPNTVVDIFATSFNGTTARVECTVEDDGAFEFPEAAKDLMLQTFTSNFPGYARAVYTVQEVGAATLILTNTTAN